MFGSTSHTAELALVIDVDDSGARAALVRVCGISQPVEIVTVAERSLSYETRTEDAYIHGIAGSIREATSAVLTQRPADVRGAVKRVYIIVHAPWIDAHIIRADSRSSSDVKITRELITHLAREAIEREHIDLSAHIESSIVRVLLNGYPTALPIGKRARHVVLSIIASTCHAPIREAVQDAATLAHVQDKPLIRSSVRPLLLGAQLGTQTAHSYTVVEVGRSGSMIVRVQHGVPTGITQVPFGLTKALELVAPQRPLTETLARIRMSQDTDDGSKTGDVTIQTAIAQAESELSSQYTQAFVSLASSGLLPNTLVISVEDAAARWIAHLFSRPEFSSVTLSQQPFVVQILDRERYSPAVMVREGVDAALGIMSAASLVYNEQIDRTA